MLHDTIQGLADAFAREVLSAIQALSLEEILSLKGLVVGGAPRASGAPQKAFRPPGRPGRLPRRSPEDVDKQAQHIVDYVKAHGPVRAEAMRAALAIDKREWLRPLQRALELGVKKEGNKRATEYSFGSKSAKPSKPSKPSKPVKSAKTKTKTKKKAPKAKAKTGKKPAKAKAKAKTAAKKRAITTKPSPGMNGQSEPAMAVDEEDEFYEVSP